MRIGVDCHVLAGKFQGSRTYLLNLYRAILGLHPEHDFVFFGHWNGERPYGTSVEYSSYPSDSRLKRLTYETAGLIRAHDIDLFHSTYIAPLVLPCQSLLTVHDVLFEVTPQYFTRPFVWRSRALVKRSVKRAQQVHTISRFSHDLLASRYGIDSDSIKIVPVGIDHGRFCPGEREEAARAITSQFGITNYVLTVGRLEPRKNHIGLVMAYHQLRNSYGEVGTLVIVGQRDFGYQGLLKMIGDLGLKDNVYILEDASDASLPDLYRAARLFVYPSFAEGFGIPIIEAMACGVPVICSNTSAMPEVAGNGALLADPHNASDLAAKMLMVLTDRVFAERLAASGVLQSRRWTWQQAAQNYLQAIEQLQ